MRGSTRTLHQTAFARVRNRIRGDLVADVQEPVHNPGNRPRLSCGACLVVVSAGSVLSSPRIWRVDGVQSGNHLAACGNGPQAGQHVAAGGDGFRGPRRIIGGNAANQCAVRHGGGVGIRGDGGHIVTPRQSKPRRCRQWFSGDSQARPGGVGEFDRRWDHIRAGRVADPCVLPQTRRSLRNGGAIRAAILRMVVPAQPGRGGCRNDRVGGGGVWSSDCHRMVGGGGRAGNVRSGWGRAAGCDDDHRRVRAAPRSAQLRHRDVARLCKEPRGHLPVFLARWRARLGSCGHGVAGQGGPRRGGGAMLRRQL